LRGAFGTAAIGKEPRNNLAQFSHVAGLKTANWLVAM
jgi:hypothetical protein